MGPAQLASYKRLGFSDAQMAKLSGKTQEEIRAARKKDGVVPVFARVDTCAAEFVANTPYMYSTYESESEARADATKKKVVILGGGPNRIGQGIEFDYCCVHAVQALRELGYETVMVNCNPETVSTDYDTADRLYFEPLTLEDVLAICDEEKPEGVIVQFGGQTPLKLAVPLEKAGVKLLGTTADAIDRAEDRGRFDDLLTKLSLRRPRSGIATGTEEAFRIAEEIGYPVLVRPSYVLGGRAMMIAYSRAELESYIHLAVEAARDAGTQTILVDEFLKDAIEVDVDCVADGKRAVIGGVMQHIEEAGVHSGDSSSVLPPHSLSPELVLSIEEQTRMLALELGVVGLMNVQFAVKGGDVYILEVNPRASRTVPFVSKATGRPLAKIAAKVMAGRTLDELGATDMEVPRHVAVKQSVFPFNKFPGVDTILGPEMRSTGEVMGIADTFARAFFKSMLAAASTCARRRTRQGREPGGQAERLHQRPRRRQAGCLHHRAASPRGGLRDCRHEGHGGRPPARTHPDRRGQQGARGIAARRRCDPERDDWDRRQHDDRRPRGEGQLLAPPADAPHEHPVLHDDCGGARGMRRARVGARRRRGARALAPGVGPVGPTDPRPGPRWAHRCRPDEASLPERRALRRSGAARVRGDARHGSASPRSSSRRGRTSSSSSAPSSSRCSASS